MAWAPTLAHELVHTDAAPNEQANQTPVVAGQSVSPPLLRRLGQSFTIAQATNPDWVSVNCLAIDKRGDINQSANFEFASNPQGCIARH
jgi:hypothetical protein